jgi:hypothetical protein
MKLLGVPFILEMTWKNNQDTRVPWTPGNLCSGSHISQCLYDLSAWMAHRIMTPKGILFPPGTDRPITPPGHSILIFITHFTLSFSPPRQEWLETTDDYPSLMLCPLISSLRRPIIKIPPRKTSCSWTGLSSHHLHLTLTKILSWFLLSKTMGWKFKCLPREASTPATARGTSVPTLCRPYR